MARIHPREQQVNLAESALAIAMWKEIEKHDLTQVEAMRVVHNACGSVLGGLIKHAIRYERHGDTDKPGGLE